MNKTTYLVQYMDADGLCWRTYAAVPWLWLAKYYLFRKVKKQVSSVRHLSKSGHWFSQWQIAENGERLIGLDISRYAGDLRVLSPDIKEAA